MKEEDLNKEDILYQLEEFISYLEDEDNFYDKYELGSYKILYEYVQKSNSPVIEAIGEFQCKMRIYAIDSVKSSYMFNVAFNVASEFLEYIYNCMLEED